MKLIKEIYDKDIDLEDKVLDKYSVRKAARAVVFNQENKIALLKVGGNNYFKLPGGGFEADEDIEAALRREVKEETGCNIEIGDDMGLIIEFKNKFKLLQFSYCYFAKVRGDICEPDFTEEEKAGGFELTWVDLNQAIDLVKKSRPNDYHGKFVKIRDLAFLQRAKSLK